MFSPPNHQQIIPSLHHPLSYAHLLPPHDPNQTAGLANSEHESNNLPLEFVPLPDSTGPVPSKVLRTSISLDQKIRICELKQQSNLSNKELAEQFKGT